MNKKIFVWGIVIVVLAIAFVSIRNKETRIPSDSTIKLGIMLPLTSQYGSVAEGIRNASLLAVEDWKAAHPGVEIETVIEDDAYQPSKGIAAYTKLKNVDHVDGIVSISTPVVDALHQTYERDGLPVINLGVQTEGATKDNIFQIFPDARGQVKPLADYLQDKTAYESVAIIHATNDPAYAQFYNEFIKLYTKSHKDVVLNTKDDAKSVAAEIASARPQAIVIILAPTLGATVTKELNILRVNADYFYDASLITGFTEYKTILGNTNILNGATTIKTVANDMNTFKAKYKAKYGVDPVIFAENGYDSTMIMLNSYNKDKNVWVKNIQNSSYVGPSGKTTFDEKGIRIPEYVVTKVVEGVVQ